MKAGFYNCGVVKFRNHIQGAKLLDLLGRLPKLLACGCCRILCGCCPQTPIKAFPRDRGRDECATPFARLSTHYNNCRLIISLPLLEK